MINCHIHTFNNQYTPEFFIRPFVKNLPDWAVRLLSNILNSRFGRSASRVLKIFPGNIRKYASFLDVGLMKTQDMVFETAMACHPSYTKFVVLPLRFEDMGAGKVSVPYEQQLKDLIDLKKRYPNTCLPFVGIDARMGTKEYIKAFTEKYIRESAFVGIKMYPPMGYWPFDMRLSDVYEFAETNELPITTHCSRGGVFYNSPLTSGGNSPLNYYTNAQSLSGSTYQYDYNGDNDAFFENLSDPERYEDVLIKYPKLKICFAHFGWDTDKAVEALDGNGELKPNVATWYAKIKELMMKYDNVYADISYSLSDKRLLKIFKNDLTDPRFRHRILYGTDFFMTLQEGLTEAELFQQAVEGIGKDFSLIATNNAVRFLTSKIWEVPA